MVFQRYGGCTPSRGMPHSARQAGLTLIELMVVLAIIGILAAVAVFMYTRSEQKARYRSEVNSVFSAIRVAEEQHHLEKGVYISTGDVGGIDEATKFPDASKKAPGDLANPPAGWDALKLTLGTTALWCEYVVIAGPAGNDDDYGPMAAIIMPPAPTTNWWYGIAFCPGNDSTYTTKWNENAVIKQ